MRLKQKGILLALKKRIQTFFLKLKLLQRLFQTL